MHLVGFTIEIYYDARPCERQTTFIVSFLRNILTHSLAQQFVQDCSRESVASPVPPSVPENLTEKRTSETSGMSVRNGLVVGTTGHCSKIL